MYKSVLYYGQTLGRAWHERRVQEQKNERKGFLKQKRLLGETAHTITNTKIHARRESKRE